ncbi:MAG: YdeI/OmpD-associated family protein, partial [Chloroflexota bacterium]
DCVEEALCFGWIDSIVKAYDADTSAQRFSRRKSKNTFSQQNRERLAWLMAHNQIHPSLIDEIKPILAENFIFPDDILSAIQSKPTAWEYYQAFSPAYQRIRIAYINTARKRPEEFERRLANFIKKTEQNKQIGFGGIDKYF